MNKHKKRSLKILGALAVFFLLVAITSFIWLYSGELTPAKFKVFNCLPLPVAVVNGRSLYMDNFNTRWQTYEKLLQNQKTSETANQAKNKIFAQMVADETISQVASRHGLYADSAQINSEYSNQTAQSKTFTESLAKYGLTEKTYKHYVLAPKLLQTELRVWFNFQEDLNQKQYGLAKDLLTQINNGADMSGLAKQYSQEATGKITGGDMGFLDPTELLPEMRESIYSLNIGETKIVPNRFGIYIIKLEDKNSNHFRLRQIYLEPENFDQWFFLQTKNYKIYKLIAF